MPNQNEHDPDRNASSIDGDTAPLAPSGLGSGLMAQQPTPEAETSVAVAKVCPQCGSEYETGDRFCPKDGAPLRPKAAGDALIGRVIADRYLILARLGEGGMGRVYLAEHVKMNRQCAIKVMNPALIHDAESLQRFAREASSAARILHPNVAAVFDYGEADKIIYLVMEYVNGESLSAILAREGALDPRRAIDIGRQIADGLQAAHELGIVHRDLKPDNVIVTRNKAGREIPKVVDFGIAKALTDAPQDSLTRSGLVIGTPEYMSPEQLLGDPIDARSDVYSLGCILYQLLTGRSAFAADSREQMIRRRLHESPPHIREVFPDLPRRLDTTIVHMLARSPKDRIANAAEARDALDPARALGGWDPGSLNSQGTVPMAAASHDDPSMRPTVPMLRVRPNPRRIVAGTIVGSVLVLGGAWAWMNLVPQRADAPTPAPAPVDSLAVAPPPTADSVKNLPPLAAKDTVAKPKPQPPPADEFDAPLRRLLGAIETKDLGAVRSAFPGMTETQESVYHDVFARAESGKVTVKSSLGSVTMNGNRATRPVRLDLRYTDPRSLNPTSSRVNYLATYEKRDDHWELVGLATP